MIQAGAEVNLADKRGWTPLHAASENKRQKRGKKGHLGSTSLHFASARGHVEVITALLAGGADKTIKDKRGKTPHDRARFNQDCKNALE